MDFKSLREQISSNIDQYNSEDMKIVIAKLLDFVVDINEKRSNLDEENKQLFEEINEFKKNPSSNEYRDKVDDIFNHAKEEAKKIVEDAKLEKEDIKNEAKADSQKIIQEAEENGQQIIQDACDKIETIIADIKIKDEEVKLYRAHILSIFQKTIFRFADSSYYIIRSDNKDFRELLHFFEVDEKLQQLSDGNLEKIEKNENYLNLIQKVEENPEIDDIDQITNILNEKQITIDNEKINVEEVINKSESIEEEIQLIEEEEIEEETSTNQQTFIDIMNKYKKK